MMPLALIAVHKAETRVLSSVVNSDTVSMLLPKCRSDMRP